MTIYFLQFHAKPSKFSIDFNNVGGAFINCWILSEDKDAAINISKSKIIELDWEILELEDSKITTENDYLKSSNRVGLQFYRQALIDKWVLQIHTYPIDEIQNSQ